MQILVGVAGLTRRGAVAVLLLALGTLAAACGGGDERPGDLADLAAVVPAALSDRGLLLRSGTDGSAMLVEALGLDADDVVATATTGAPAVRVLRVADPGVVLPVLAAAGWTGQAAPDGWQVLVRPDGIEGFAGIPAVAIGPGLVAVGSDAELRALGGGGDPLPVAVSALDGAASALVQPSAALDGGTSSPVQAGDLPVFTSVLLTAEADGAAGVLALQLPRDGTQADAVGLAVRVRTAGPVDDGGRGVLLPGSPLTAGAVVQLDVEWGADPIALLGGGLGSGLLDFLGRG